MRLGLLLRAAVRLAVLEKIAAHGWTAMPPRSMRWSCQGPLHGTITMCLFEGVGGTIIFIALPQEVRECSHRPCVLEVVLQCRDEFLELSNILRARPVALLGRALIDGEASFIVSRLEWIAQPCPLHVLLALVRTVLNLWPTDRRFGKRGGRCMLGCYSVDADDTCHYVLCPVLWEYFAARLDLRQLVWADLARGCALRCCVDRARVRRRSRRQAH